MRYAQQAATELLNQLQNSDLTGVIAFDSEPYMLAPLAPLAENRAELLSKIGERQEPGEEDGTVSYRTPGSLRFFKPEWSPTSPTS